MLLSSACNPAGRGAPLLSTNNSSAGVAPSLSARPIHNHTTRDVCVRTAAPEKPLPVVEGLDLEVRDRQERGKGRAEDTHWLIAERDPTQHTHLRLRQRHKK